MRLISNLTPARPNFELAAATHVGRMSATGPPGGTIRLAESRNPA